MRSRANSFFQVWQRLYTFTMARPILLAVDDDVSVLEAVVQDLRRQYGSTYRVMRAASGQAALDMLE